MTERKELKKQEEDFSLSEMAAIVDDGGGMDVSVGYVSSDGKELTSFAFTSKNKDICFKDKNKPNIKVEVSSTAQKNDKLLHSLL